MGCSSSLSCCLRRTASAQLYGGRAVPEVLRTERLRRVFGGLVPVNDIEFTAQEGEIVGLIGPNGAAKTTFFNLVRRARGVPAGRRFFQGRELTHRPAHRRAELRTRAPRQLTR